MYADTRPVENLIQMAGALRFGTALKLTGMAMRPIYDLYRIAEAAPGSVSFSG